MAKMGENNKTNDKFNKVNSLIINNDRFLIAVDGADVDAVAAGLGLVQLLKTMDKEVVLFSPVEISAGIWSVLDGQENFALKEKDQIVVNRAAGEALLLHSKNWDYFRTLREKYDWGISK